jgi:hypothetical protein
MSYDRLIVEAIKLAHDCCGPTRPANEMIYRHG